MVLPPVACSAAMPAACSCRGMFWGATGVLSLAMLLKQMAQLRISSHIRSCAEIDATCSTPTVTGYSAALPDCSSHALAIVAPQFARRAAHSRDQSDQAGSLCACLSRHQRRVVLRGHLLQHQPQHGGRLRGGLLARQLLPDLVPRRDLLAAAQPAHVRSTPPQEPSICHAPLIPSAGFCFKSFWQNIVGVPWLDWRCGSWNAAS